MEVMEKKPTVVIKPIIFTNEKFHTMAVQESDSVINLNGKYRIPVNRSVLNERCNFFTSMQGFQEAKTAEIGIGYDGDVTDFNALMDYIHTGIIELTTGNLEAVILDAVYFQMDDLLKFSCDVLKQNINLQTVGYLYDLTKKVSLIGVKKAVVDFEAEHFHKIADSRVFLKWSVECMLELLSSDEVVVSHEKKVLSFLFDWLKLEPSVRGEHATDLCHKLRFSYLNKKDMENVVEESSNEKLCQILHQVASEFSNKITPRRIYEKGIYLLGETQSSQPGDGFLRYSPDDGSVTSLKTPSSCLQQLGQTKIVENNNDIYIVRINGEPGTWNINIENYDAKKDAWKSTASTQTENFHQIRLLCVSYCQDKIFVFVSVWSNRERGRWRLSKFCMVYCFKTNTWHRLPVFKGKSITSATACGDSIYMTRRDSYNLLQYVPSTEKLIDIPCQYLMKYGWATAHKSKIFFLMDQHMMNRKIVMFNTDTKAFRSYDFNVMYLTNAAIHNHRFTCALFKETVYFFCNEKVMKLDLSFIDERKEPQLIRLPDSSGMNMIVYATATIQ